MDTVLRFAALGAVLILSMESEAGIFNDVSRYFIFRNDTNTFSKADDRKITNPGTL
jgi:hypothetical protein